MYDTKILLIGAYGFDWFWWAYYLSSFISLFRASSIILFTLDLIEMYLNLSFIVLIVDHGEISVILVFQ